ncbi:hypothetical protein C4X99_13825 [Leptospira interrogans serovar Geyaweera]|nr:hypothetical protein C5473_08685 [Leptospira interrogans serovar Weerasinghe]KAA1291303.1 hypothetical protein C4X99_13825 [Leptospira interrogans serovar Geyaweera]
MIKIYSKQKDLNLTKFASEFRECGNYCTTKFYCKIVSKMWELLLLKRCNPCDCFFYVFFFTKNIVLRLNTH